MGDHVQWQKTYYEQVVRHDPTGSVWICLDHYNKRVRLDDYSGMAEAALKMLEEAAEQTAAEKIIAKVRAEHLPLWMAYGYVVEGKWDGYFRGNDGYGVSRFKDRERRIQTTSHKEDTLLCQLQERGFKAAKPLGSEFTTRIANTDDAIALSHLYRIVFQAYPTPIFDPDYVRYRMEDGMLVRAIWNRDGQIVSAASVEVCLEQLNGEVTDCATDPTYRGHGWTRILIDQLQQDCRERNLITLYALSRANVPAINTAFWDLGYQYRGRFMNNCRMDAGYENMNLWLKWL